MARRLRPAGTRASVICIPDDLADFFKTKAQKEGRVYSVFISELTIESLQDRRRQIESAASAK